MEVFSIIQEFPPTDVDALRIFHLNMDKKTITDKKWCRLGHEQM